MTDTAIYRSAVESDSFLLRSFREFYRELLRLKSQIQSLREGWNEVTSSAVTGSAAKEVWQRLMDLFEQQEVEAKRVGGEYGYQLYKEAQYAMVVLADEVLLTTSWAGRAEWNDNLLESALFRSHAAGDVFFQRVDVLLNNRETLRAEIAAIYLLTLSLGFQGRYRNSEAASDLFSYRSKLYGFIYQRQPELLKQSLSFNEQPYHNTVDDSEETRLPNVRKWGVATVGVFVLYLAITGGIWTLLVSDLRAVIATIISQ